MQNNKSKSPIYGKPENLLTFMEGSRESEGLDGAQRYNKKAMMGIEVNNFEEEKKQELAPEPLGKYLQPSISNLVQQQTLGKSEKIQARNLIPAQSGLHIGSQIFKNNNEKYVD